MKAGFYLMFLFLLPAIALAQDPVNDTLNSAVTDSIDVNYQMEEIVISNVKSTLTPEDQKRLQILRRRVLKVYPYAKIASERLTLLNANMAKLKTNKEKKKYSKIVEKYLEDEFESQLKKLSRKDGQILVKLIHRQTGHSTFDLIKEYKSGWRAFWSNRIAKLFDINIRETYRPIAVPEDYYIEGFLIKAFDEGRLREQAPAFEINYKAITDSWKEKNKKLREKKNE
ncbi:MAG: DUF4294 domain-containing protein [Flavobacterium sp.]|nr:MAG: DUF4294 domain-containing protein [Flavobacterium sp.]